MQITVRYFAAAAAAAGTEEETVELAPDDTVADLLADRELRYGSALADVLSRCSFLLDAVVVHERDVALRDRQVIDVLPPFAGG
jgi:sulfur-carrier protein